MIMSHEIFLRFKNFTGRYRYRMCNLAHLLT